MGPVEPLYKQAPAARFSITEIGSAGVLPILKRQEWVG
jgi:hypothetical protein